MTNLVIENRYDAKEYGIKIKGVDIGTAFKEVVYQETPTSSSLHLLFSFAISPLEEEKYVDLCDFFNNDREVTFYTSNKGCNLNATYTYMVVSQAAEQITGALYLVVTLYPIKNVVGKERLC